MDEEAKGRLLGLRSSQWVWLIVAVGAVVRLIALGHKSFWIDEIASVSIAQKPSAAFWRFLWHDEGNMALYYVLLRPWLLFGKSEAVVRLLSVLPGVASIPLMYVVAKQLFGREAGLLAAGLFALNPCAIASSQEARAYSFMVFAVLLSTYVFMRLTEEPSYALAIVYGVVAGLGCYFHYFGVLIPAAHAVSLVAVPADRRPWRQYGLAAAIFVVLASPVLWLIHAQDTGHISWVQSPSLLEFYHLGVFLAASGGKAVGGVLLVLDVVLIGLFLRALTRVWAKDNDLRWPYTLTASQVFSPIVLTLMVSLVRPVFYHRFLIICLPAFVMMTAVGALRIPRQSWRLVAVTGVCVLSLACTVMAYSRVTEDWRGAISYLIANERPGDRVLYYEPVGYFAGQNYRGWLAGENAYRPVETAVDPADNSWEQKIENAPRVWLVLYRARPDDAQTRAIEQELLKHYTPGEPKSFRGITVMEYDAR